MDTQRDFKPFQALMDELNATLRDGFKARDETVRGYWDALKDVAFSEVHANAKRIMATATKETHFPRPRELRNRAPVIEARDGRQEAAERASHQAWDELKALDPVRFRVEFGMARAARELAELAPCDPGFEEVQREYQRWASVRYAPRAEQERAVARYEGS